MQSEIDYENLDWGKMMVNVYPYSPKQDLRELFPVMFSYSEYYPEQFKELDIKKALRWVALTYDKGCPLPKVLNDVRKVKVKAADIAGFIRQEDGRFMKQVEEMMICNNPTVNKMIIRYCLSHKSALYTEFHVLSELYQKESANLLAGDKSNIKDFQTIGERLDKIRQELLNHDNSVSLQQDLTAFYFQDKLFLRPEDIAKKRQRGEEPVKPPEKKKPEAVPENILQQYTKEDEWVMMNEDKHLHPIWIPLPKCEDITQADGYGQPAKDQIFQYQVWPKKLLKLIDQCEKIDEIWSVLQENQAEFYQEIKWIEKQWWHYFNGYWCMINGKPTFIDGWYYTYLNFWHFKDGKRPDYRDRHRRFYIALKYAYTTTETPKIDGNKISYFDAARRIPNMLDTGRRTCMGAGYPKPRKDGASNMCECAEYMEVITHKGVVGGILSMTGEHAEEKLFDEIMVPGWQQMPFFYKPKTISNQSPESEIKFDSPRKRADTINTDSLGSKINYSTTATSKMYDGGNNIWITVDESGKCVADDVYIRHRQLKPCVSLGNGANIFGFLSYPSTVGEMAGDGGLNFFRICKESQWEQRDISGQTRSGMFVYYISAADGLEGFVGKYGESIIKDPTPEQAQFIGKTYGALEYLLDKRKKLEEAGDIEGYNEEIRLFPITYMECFRTEDGEIGFNSRILNERIDELVVEGDNLWRIGNFEWEGEKYKSKVKWKDDPKGRWRVSKLLHERESNHFSFIHINGTPQRTPTNSRFILCTDPYKQTETKGSKMSDGGIAVFWEQDGSENQTEPRLWKSHRFVCTYRNRPGTTGMFYDDAILTAQYFGAMVYPETNVPNIIDHFEETGYSGYFLYDINPKTGKYEKLPGFNSGTMSKQKLFNGVRDYIELHGMRDVHIDFLKECKDIQSMDEMTDFDLFTACAGCLLGTRSKMGKIIKMQAQTVKAPPLFRKRRYR